MEVGKHKSSKGDRNPNELYFARFFVFTNPPELMASLVEPYEEPYNEYKYPLMKWKFSNPIEKIQSFRRLNPAIPIESAQDCTINCLKFLGVVDSDIASILSMINASFNTGTLSTTTLSLVRKSVESYLENLKIHAKLIHIYGDVYSNSKILGKYLNNGDFILILGQRDVTDGHAFLLTKINSILHIFDPQVGLLIQDTGTEYIQTGKSETAVIETPIMMYLKDYKMFSTLVYHVKRPLEYFEFDPKKQQSISNKRQKRYNKIRIPKDHFSQTIQTLNRELNNYKDIIPESRESMPNNLTETSNELIERLDQIVESHGIRSDHELFQKLIQDLDNGVEIDYKFKEEFEKIMDEFNSILERRKNTENMKNIWGHIFSFYNLLASGPVSNTLNDTGSFIGIIPSLKQALANLINSIDSYKRENAKMYDTSKSVVPVIDRISELDNSSSVKAEHDDITDEELRAKYGEEYADLNDDELINAAVRAHDNIIRSNPEYKSSAKADEEYPTEDSEILDSELRLQSSEDQELLERKLQEEMELQTLLEHMRELAISITNILDSINNVKKLLGIIRDRINRYKYEIDLNGEPRVEFYGGKSRKIKKRNIKTRKSKNKSKNKTKNKPKNKLFYWKNKK